VNPAPAGPGAVTYPPRVRIKKNNGTYIYCVYICILYIFVYPDDKTENPNYDPPLGGVRYDSDDATVSASEGDTFFSFLFLFHPTLSFTPIFLFHTYTHTHAQFISYFILTREHRSIRIHSHHIIPILHLYYIKYNILTFGLAKTLLHIYDARKLYWCTYFEYTTNKL